LIVKNKLANRTYFNYTQIPLYISVFGILAIVGIVMLGHRTYSILIDEDQKKFCESYMAQAAMLKINIESQLGAPDSQVLLNTLKIYRASTNRPNDEYLCITDSTSKIILHTFATKTIGNFAGGNKIFEKRSNKISNLKELISTQKDFAGNYISSAGQDQLATFCFVPGRRWLIGIHRSAESLKAETAQRFKKYMYGIGIFCLLISLSIVLMYLPYRRAMKRLKDAKQKASSEYLKWLNILNNVHWGIAIGNVTEKKLELVNKAYSEMHGYTEEELIGSDVEELFPVGKGSELDEIIKDTKRNGKCIFETFHRRKDGTIFPVSIDISYVDSYADSDPFYVVNIQDTTERNREKLELKESEEKFRLIFDQAATGISHLSPEGKWLRANKKTCEIMGYGHDELTQHYIQDFTHPEDLVKLNANLELLLTNQTETFNIEKRFIKKDGNIVWVDLNVSCSLNENKTIKYLIAVVHETTLRKAAETALKASEERYRTYIDNAPSAIFVTNNANRFIEVNNCAMEMTGYTESELLQLAINDLIEPEEIDYFFEHLYRLKATGKSSCEIKICRKEGSSFSVQLDTVRLDDDHAIDFCSDISLQKKLTEALKNIIKIGPSQSNNSFLDSLVIQLGKILDADYVFVGELNEKTGQEIQTLSVCFNGGIIPNTSYHLQGTPSKHVLESGLSIFVKEISHHFPGDQILKDWNIDGYAGIPLFDFKGKVIGILAAMFKKEILHTDFCRSILELLSHRTSAEMERKLAVQGLIDLNRTLEERVANRTARLEEVNNELKDFAYIISHDLKAPLRSISQLSSWFAADYESTLDANGKELLVMLRNRVSRMNNLIDGVLQYSRIGRTEEKTEEIHLDNLLQNIIDLLALPQNIQIQIQPQMPVIYADKTRIQQVFQNLVSNAIKYMDKPQGEIHITWQDNDAQWQFSIADNGPGINEKYFDRIFQIFQTLAPKDEKESTGIGLSIVKKIVESYGGKIWVQSVVGQGSVFSFTISKKEQV
jgi:PAS domain S-box-containing protein